MVRPLRVLREGLTYHVTARGNGRMRIFRDDVDRVRFLELLAESVNLFAMSCHAYCEMDNHYHAILTTSRPNLSRAMQHLHAGYAQWWNARHRRRGHMLGGRFGARIVQDQGYLLDVARYVVLNPVKALMVVRPETWRWSSYRATAGLEARPEFLDVTTILRCFGAPESEAALQQYCKFVRAGIPEVLRGSSTRRRGAIDGDAGFVHGLLANVDPGKEITRTERLQGRPTLRTLFKHAARRTDREASMATAFVEFGYSMKEIAEFLDVHYSTVSRAVSAVMSEGSERAKCVNARSDPS